MADARLEGELATDAPTGEELREQHPRLYAQMQRHNEIWERAWRYYNLDAVDAQEFGEKKRTQEAMEEEARALAASMAPENQDDYDEYGDYDVEEKPKKKKGKSKKGRGTGVASISLSARNAGAVVEAAFERAGKWAMRRPTIAAFAERRAMARARREAEAERGRGASRRLRRCPSPCPSPAAEAPEAMGGEAVRSSRVMHAARAAIEKTMTRLDDSITLAGALARVRRASSLSPSLGVLVGPHAGRVPRAALLGVSGERPPRAAPAPSRFGVPFGIVVEIPSSGVDAEEGARVARDGLVRSRGVDSRGVPPDGSVVVRLLGEDARVRRGVELVESRVGRLVGGDGRDGAGEDGVVAAEGRTAGGPRGVRLEEIDAREHRLDGAGTAGDLRGDADGGGGRLVRRRGGGLGGDPLRGVQRRRLVAVLEPVAWRERVGASRRVSSGPIEGISGAGGRRRDRAKAKRSDEAHAPTRVLFVYFHIRASSAMVAVKPGRASRAGGCDCGASVAYSGFGAPGFGNRRQRSVDQKSPIVFRLSPG